MREQLGTSAVLDHWAEWLLRRRHGGDPDQLRRFMDFLIPVRDRVLDNALIGPSETVLDVGCGDGLIALGALDRVGDQGVVVFSDISEDLLVRARELAEQADVAARCRFVLASAEDLAPIADGSVDVVTTRSVLIYVRDKQRALAEFFRVLRPGGRISLFEPINRFRFPAPAGIFGSYDAAPVHELAQRVKAVYAAYQPADTDPMLNFDERDLLAFVEEAGFAEWHLEYRADVTAAPPRSWEVALRSAGNPNAPTLGEAIAEALTADEAERFAAHLRPLVEAGGGVTSGAAAYLWAMKSGPSRFPR